MDEAFWSATRSRVLSVIQSSEGVERSEGKRMLERKRCRRLGVSGIAGLYRLVGLGKRSGWVLEEEMESC